MAPACVARACAAMALQRATTSWPPAHPPTRTGGLRFFRPAVRNIVRPRASVKPEPEPVQAAEPEPVQAAAPDTEPTSTAAVEPVHSGFDWAAHWYPISLVSELDATLPNAQRVLGEHVVLWRDGDGIWRALRDACPHRLAPLSQGRIAEDGSLTCSYHGWRFGGCGACTAVPQTGGAAAASSPRSSAFAFPTLVAQGLLWIWPSARASRFHDAAATPAPLVPGLQESGTRHPAAPSDGGACEERGVAHVRDLPLSYMTLVENLADPSHVAYAHHGVVTVRDKAPLTPLVVTQPLSAAGFQVFTQGNPGKLPPQRHTFQAPALLKQKQERADTQADVTFGHGDSGGLYMYVTPLSEGVTRIITRRVVPAGARAPWPVELQAKLVWPAHTLINEVFDGDVSFLHHQERIVAADARERSRYFLGTTEDMGVAALRSWMRQWGNGGPFGPSTLPPALPRQQQLDRWAQHASHCAACRRAGVVAGASAQAMRACSTAAVVAAGAAGALAAAGQPMLPAAFAAAVAAPALGAIGEMAAAVDSSLRFRDYVHGRR